MEIIKCNNRYVTKVDDEYIEEIIGVFEELAQGGEVGYSNYGGDCFERERANEIANLFRYIKNNDLELRFVKEVNN